MRYRGFERVKDASKDVKLPTRATSGSAGYDFYSPNEFTIEPYGFYKLKTGIRVFMPKDEVFLINVRSSIGIKKNLGLMNTQAVIDSDFAYSTDENAGNIILVFRNFSDKSVKIAKDERIAQGIFIKYSIIDEDIPLADIRTGGIGSSGE